MKTIEIGNIAIQFDYDKTKNFYTTQYEFGCDCPDCLNYVDKYSVVKDLIQGLDEELGIDLSKDVGQGIDELMPHDNEDHCLYIIPYYISGRCLVDGLELAKNKRVEYKLDECLNLTIVNSSDYIEFENSKSILTLWIEFKTPLLKA